MGDPQTGRLASLRETIELDVRSLAAFRVALGATLIADLIARASDLQAFYTDAGVLPRTEWLAIAEPWWFSFHLATGSTFGQGVLFLIAGAAALALALGWRWRLASFASYVLLLSLRHRNPFVTDFGDQTLQVLLLWAPFLPLDSYKFRNRTGPPSPRVGTLGTAGYLVQLVVIYGSAACHKVQSPLWIHGLVLPRVLQAESLQTPFGRALSMHPSVCAALAYFTLAVELLVPLALFWPRRTQSVRAGMVALFIGLHLGFALSLRLGIFPVISLVAWLPVVPSAVWEWIGLRAVGGGAPAAESRQARAAVLALLAIVEGWTFLTLAPPTALRSALDGPLGALGLDQEWSMFDGAPPNDGWFSLPATLASGARVDLLTGDGLVDGGRPDPARVYGDQRWTNYLVVLANPGQKELVGPWIDYLCRTWNVSHSDPVVKVEADFIAATPGQAPERQLRTRGTCTARPVQASR